MSLRCLLFSSHPEIVQPIREVLAEIGIEGEHCESGVDAVEKVTTHLFQIVITDWSDQPEASFLLKTARDQKAAHRPLTLAIVSEGDRPAALQAGANSVLLKPIRVEQVRDTMRTACDLLRAKQQQAAGTASPAAKAQSDMALPAAASASSSAPLPSSTSASPPASVGQSPETGFRPGEFLPSAGAGPGSQFDTEKETLAQISRDEQMGGEVDALAELEPTAAAVPERPEVTADSSNDEPAAKVSGWAELQARLNAGTRPPVETAKSEMLSYIEMGAAEKDSVEHSESREAEPAPAQITESSVDGPAERVAAEPVSVIAEVSDAEKPSAAAREPQSNRARNVVLPAIAACFLVAAAVPRTRLLLIQNGHFIVRAAQAWLNPAPPQVPQAAAQHESFAQPGDEYKLPTATAIPDATTDPSQIRIVPVVDPTVKPDKNASTTGGPSQATAISPQDSSRPALATSENPGAQSQNPANGPANEIASSKPADAATPSTVPTTTVPGNSAVQAVAPTNPAIAPAQPVAQKPSPLHTVSVTATPGIPSSLQTQLAPNVPAAGGTAPPEEAMSAIEPVKLPEAAVRDLLAQKVDPEYPASAKASGMQGSVTLQVLIGHDGTVQDAKFLQGSLLFARAAIDAVKQWQFKPYSMNGQVVSVQSTLTLNFRP